MSTPDKQVELEAERAHNRELYARLDAQRQRVEHELTAALRAEADTPWHRDVAVSTLRRRQERLVAAEHGLCFGRIDDDSGTTDYIGRIGLFAEERDHEPLVLDWRAPAARRFYTATRADGEGFLRRRHLRTDHRDILDFHDEALHPDGAAQVDDDDPDAALLAALDAPRGSVMRDIVATLQSEQDEIIRSQHGGVLVVEGGPGTGKTAVALHRVAYLLYHERERLSRRGVLVVGPHREFLRYIGAVLPSLGETAVVFATIGDLFPGMHVTAVDTPQARAVKGSARMVSVLAAAVADRQELPTEPHPIVFDDVTVELDADLAHAARARARESGLLHNAAQQVFRETLADGVIDRAVRRIGAEWLDESDHLLWADLRAEVELELREHPGFAAVVQQLWPQLTPQRLLAELLSDQRRIEAAAVGLSEEECAALFRREGGAWTVPDVPLLDEAVEFLGEIPQGAEHSADDSAGGAADAEYARGVLEILDTDPELDSERPRAVDVVDAAALSERHEPTDHRTTAERALTDRDWTYGHVVVDEAQELAQMDWRVLMRRCPSRSMTVVGDRDQRESPAGARQWAEMLDEHGQGRWRRRELTVNYRTPAEIAEVAEAARIRLGGRLHAPRAVRSTGVRPWARRVGAAELATELERLVRQEASAAVLAPEELAAAPLPEELVLEGAGADASPRQSRALSELRGALAALPCPVLAPAAAKGLEFDVVLLVEPHRIGDPSALYVACTRATQRLGVLHTEPLPPHLADLFAVT